MKNTKVFKTSLIVLCSVALGASINNFAFSDVPSNFKIAVVDVNQVINSSSQVKALNKSEEAKKEELTKWLDTVKKDIDKQSTEENKQKLAKKYSDQLQKKHETNRDEYTKKLTEIDKNISSVIQTVAVGQGYNIVLAKSIVLYGGDDITSAVIKAVK